MTIYGNKLFILLFFHMKLNNFVYNFLTLLPFIVTKKNHSLTTQKTPHKRRTYKRR